MRKIFVFVLMLVVVLGLAGCGKKADNSAKEDNSISQNEENQGGETDNLSNPNGDYTINELLSMSKPMKCKWSEDVTQGGEVTNIIYLNGKKFYQEVTMGDIGHAYTISDGEYMYIWNDFSNAASKINIKEAEKNAPTCQTSPKETANMEQKRYFECERWSPDNSIFNPPSDKNFQDITEEMTQAVGDLQQNSAANAEASKKMICDLCEQAPEEEAKTRCRQNAGCE